MNEQDYKNSKKFVQILSIIEAQDAEIEHLTSINKTILEILQKFKDRLEKVEARMINPSAGIR